MRHWLGWDDGYNKMEGEDTKQGEYTRSAERQPAVGQQAQQDGG